MMPHSCKAMPDQPPQISPPPVTGVEMSILRTYSLPVESHSSSEKSPTRATFPFKPASALLTLQKSTYNSSSACINLPPHFRPTPVVPALTMQPRRCASFPIDLQSESRQPSPTLKAPDWIVSDSREKSTVPFPISVNLPVDNECWWLKEMAIILILKGRLSTIVQAAEDEIELVESEEDIDVVEEVQVENSVATDDVDSVGQESTQSESSEESSHPKCIKDIIAIDKSTTESSFPPLTNSQQQQYSADEMRVLQEKMKDLRIEMEQAEDLDPKKRLKMEQMFQQVEGAIQIDEQLVEAQHGTEAKVESTGPAPSAIDHIRRSAVAITGGTLTVAGVALIPCPIIPGFLVIYGGLLVLATEFEAAKNALDTMKEPLEQWLADDEEKSDAAEDEKINSVLWEEMIGYTLGNDIDDEFMTLIDPNRRREEDSIDNGNCTTTDSSKAMKQFLRKVLMLDSSEADANKDERKGNDNSKQSLSPSCHSDLSLSGCKFLSFDCDGDGVENEDVTDDSNENTQHRQNTIDLERLCSDGSITLNTLNNCDDETIRMFSRQNTSGSSFCNDNDCLWLQFGCNSFLDEGQLRHAIEKKR